MKNILSILIILILVGCSKKEQKRTEPVYAVKSAIVEKKDLPLYLDNIGHIVSINSVNINSRIEGELLKVHFKEGQEVKEGDLMFTIDPRPYENQLSQAQGLLDENIANLYIAKDKLLRNSELIKEDYISQLDFDQLNTDVVRLESIIKQNQAELENAKLNLAYCYIYAPINGKTGILQINEGNMIYPNNQNTLITLNQITPIYVQFSAPEIELPRIQKYFNNEKLKVRVAFEDLEKEYIEGELFLIDNSVDTENGMINLKAQFQNENRVLWPGKFVKTRLILTIQKDALMVPYQAIQNTVDGPKIFVIKDNKIEIRAVILGQKEDENIIIEKGVSAGEIVVTEGQINLYNGAMVSIKEDEK